MSLRIWRSARDLLTVAAIDVERLEAKIKTARTELHALDPASAKAVAAYELQKAASRLYTQIWALAESF